MKRKRKDKHFIKKPIYPGGLTAMRKFISANLQYPKEALENKKEGTVKLRYDIDYKGRVFDVHVLSSVGYGCDEEAERLVRLFKFEIEKTRKVKVVFHKVIQINFRLPKVKKPIPPKPATPIIKKVSYSYTTTNNGNNAESNESNSNSYGYTINIKK